MWLQGIQSAPSSDPGFAPRVYREGGRVYTESISGQSKSESAEIPGVTVGYVGTEDGPWYPGKLAQLYDLNGNLTSEFVIEDPNKRDIGEMLALGIIGSIATAGLLNAVGGLGGSAAGGVTGGVTQAGPTLSKAVLDGTTAFGANSIPGAYNLAGAGAGAAGAAGIASSGGGIGATLSSALGTVKTALGITSAVGGLTGSGGATGSGQTPMPTGPTIAPPGTVAGIDPLWLLAGAAVVVFLISEA